MEERLRQEQHKARQQLAITLVTMSLEELAAAARRFAFSLCTHIHTHIYTYIYIHLYAHIRRNIKLSIHSKSYEFVNAHTYTYIHMHTNTCPHTHAHKYMPTSG